MVERPIKKSERQAVATSDGITEPSNDVAETSDDVGEVLEAETIPLEGTQEAVTQSPQRRSIPRPLAKDQKDQKKGRGEQNDRRSDRSPANPALMRGPKPTKPKPPVVQEIETPSEDSVPAEEVAATES